MTTAEGTSPIRTSTLKIPESSGPSSGRALKRILFGGGLRVEIMAIYVLALTLAIAGSLLALRAILLNRMDERIQANLQQEVAELRKLSKGDDPETGKPFDGRVRRIFDAFLQRNIPAPNETMLSIVDGDPYLRPSRDPHYRIDTDRELVAIWAAADEPLGGRADTPVGDFDYLAVPLVVDGEKRGVFVVGEFRDFEKAQVDDAVRLAALVSLITLGIGSVLAWRLAEKILRRVGAVSTTAHAISGTDLDRRIDVVGRDEIAQLSATFNEMLDRLQLAFDQQQAFVDDAGHELRTPITIIRGHLEVLGDDPAEREETKALVLDELERMRRIVDDLLVLAKAEKPDFLNLEPVDVSALSDHLYEKARALGDREWKLTEKGRGLIEADRQRLTQAMMQLAQNAVQHTGPGSKIEIGSRVSDGTARFWVTDQGTGIPAGEREQIFQRFARARGAFRSSDGAGLGLSIVKAIAEGHHGEVKLESELGKGSTFTISLPVDQPYVEGEG